MTIKKRRGCNSKTGRCKLSLAGDLTIETVAQNHVELTKLFDRYRHFDIDLAALEEIDCSGIQLLLALQHSVSTADKQLTLSSAPTAITDAMDLLRVRQQFNWDTAN